MYCSIVDEGPGGFRTNSKQAVAEHEAKTKDKGLPRDRNELTVIAS